MTSVRQNGLPEQAGVVTARSRAAAGMFHCGSFSRSVVLKMCSCVDVDSTVEDKDGWMERLLARPVIGENVHFGMALGRWLTRVCCSVNIWWRCQDCKC